MTRTVRGIRSVRFMDDPRHELIGSSAVVVTPTTLNPADTYVNLVLSNGNKTFTSPANFNSVNDGSRSIKSKTAGKFFVECSIVTDPDVFMILGLANAAEVLTSALQNTAISAQSDGSIRVNGTSSLFAGAAVGAGNVMGIAFDLTAKLFWARKNAGNWNNLAIGSSNPATGVGGVSFSTVTGPYFVMASAFEFQGGQGVLNFGPSFTNAAPVGFGVFG